MRLRLKRLDDSEVELGVRNGRFIDPDSQDSDVVDLTHGYALPGLVDAHAHLQANGVEEMVDATPDSLGPDEQLGALCTRMIEFVGTDHLGLILHTEVPRLSDEAQRAIALSHRELSEAFTGIYRRGVGSGQFRGMPEPLAGRLIFQVIMTAGRTVMDADEPKQEVHEMADTAVRFLLQGLRA